MIHNSKHKNQPRFIPLVIFGFIIVALVGVFILVGLLGVMLVSVNHPSVTRLTIVFSRILEFIVGTFVTLGAGYVIKSIFYLVFHPKVVNKYETSIKQLLKERDTAIHLLDSSGLDKGEERQKAINRIRHQFDPQIRSLINEELLLFKQKAPFIYYLQRNNNKWQKELERKL